MENRSSETANNEGAQAEKTAKQADNKVNNDSTKAEVSSPIKRKGSESDTDVSKAKKARLTTATSVTEISSSLQVATV